MRTFSAFRRVARIVIVVPLFATVAQAHPGHDGHELTWDFGHLAAHPAATLLWAVVFAAAIGGATKVIEVAAEAMRTAATHRKFRRSVR